MQGGLNMVVDVNYIFRPTDEIINSAIGNADFSGIISRNAIRKKNKERRDKRKKRGNK